MRKTSNPTKQDLLDFAAERSWKNSMDKGGLDSWSNYAGPDHGHAVIVLGRNRDSDILVESNFESALEALGGEGKYVKILRIGHWACGWIEYLTVNPKSLKKLRIAYNITKALEDYPVLDDSDYSEREHERYSDFAESEKESLAEALSEHFGLKLSPTLIELAYQLNMEDQYHSGPDSCINIYTSRKPDRRDLQDLRSASDHVSCNTMDWIEGHALSWENSRIFHKLSERVDAALASYQ